MAETPTAADWSAARGEKWRAKLPAMEATLKPVDAPLIAALDLDRAYRIADIGCGGGGTTLELARKAPEGSVVHGFDLSPALIEAARCRATSEVDFEVADMGTAPPPSSLYHRLVSRFGIMFFDDPQGAFASIARWLAPGGRFAFAAWGSPAENVWMTSIREAVTEFIDVPRPDPDGPGPFRYADAPRLVTLLEQAGFGEVRVNDWRGKLPIGGGVPAAEAADFGISSFSSFIELLAEAGPEVLNGARDALASRLRAYEQEGTVQMDACVHIFTGTRS